jgi:DNA/RNA endonuclease YhcR with UshA esterase domain
MKILFLSALFLIVFSTISYSQDTVQSKEAKDFIGETKVVKGPVAGVFVSNKGTVLINFDEGHPNSTFVAVIYKDAAVTYDDIKKGSILTITGKIEEYKGKPQIILTEQSQIISVE